MKPVRSSVSGGSEKKFYVYGWRLENFTAKTKRMVKIFNVIGFIR